jgi:hypothetical protein
MSGKHLAEQVAALPEGEREQFIIELLHHPDIAEDLEDVLLVESRRREPSVPFDDVLAALKRDGLA